MHHMAVPLEGHEFVGPHRAELRHPPDVVSSEIDKHDMLGAFLGMLDEFSGKTPIVIVVDTTLSGSSDRPAHHLITPNLHHRFR